VGHPEGVSSQRVTLQDQFGSMSVDVRKPTFLCDPVDKNGEGIHDILTHLMCYQVKQVKTEPQFQKVLGVFVHNQFGPERLDVKKPSELCVPALKNRQLVPTPTVTPTPTPTSLPGLGCGQQPAPLCAADCGPFSNCIPLDRLLPGADGCVCEPPTPTPSPAPTL